MKLRLDFWAADHPLLMRFGHISFALLTIAIGLAVYLQIVNAQHHVNDRTDRSDQRAYMDFSRKAHESHFHFTGGRNRMPLYPWIQAVFYSPELTELEFFDQGKRVNALISLLGLSLIGTVFFSRFSKPFALHSLIVIAYMLFALKAPWFQAEILYYVLLWLSFVIAIEAIQKPAWLKSLALGVTFSLAHFTKASALPGLIIYAISYVVPLIQGLNKRSFRRSNSIRNVGYAVAPVVIFAVLLFPYFRESRDRYGHYLYNVNTTFYMWYDSWAEAKEGTWQAGDRVGWPDLPPDEIPSLAKYLSEHSAEDILSRFSDSARILVSSACIRADSQYMFGNCVHIVASAIMSMASLAYFLVRSPPQIRMRHLHAALFAITFLVLYLLASLWYSPIISGTRLTFALVLPLFWTFGLLERLAGLDSLTYVFWGHSFMPIRILYGLFITVAVIQVFELATHRAATLYGGA